MASHGEIIPSATDLILGTATNALDTARGLQTRRTGSIYVEDGTDAGSGIVFGEQAAEYQGAARVDADGNMTPLVDTSQLEQDIKNAAEQAQSAVDSAAAAATDAASALTNANAALARATHVTTSQTAPTENVVKGDIWFPTNEAGNVTGMKTWDGSTWVDVQLVAGSVLVPGSVGATVIADGAITTPKLTVTEDMMVELLKAHKIEADEIDLNTLNGHTINGVAIKGSTVTGGIFQTDASGYRLRIRNTKFVTDDMTIDPDHGDNEIGVFVKSSHGVLEFLKDDTSLGSLGFTSENGTIGVALGLGQQNNFIIANNGDDVSVGSAGTVNIIGTTGVTIDSTGSVTVNNAVLPKPVLSNATINTATINTATLTKPTLSNATINTATVNSATLNSPTVKDSVGSAVITSSAINHVYTTYNFCRTDGQKKLNNGNTYMKLFNKTGNLAHSTGSKTTGMYVTGLASGFYQVEAGMTTSENGTNCWRTLLIDVGNGASKIGWGRDEYNTSGGYSMLNASCIVKITSTTGWIQVVAGGNKTADMRDNGQLAITRI